MDGKLIQSMLDTINATPVLSADRQTVEEAVAMWREVRAKRLEMGRLTDAMQQMETAFKSWILEVLKQQNMEGVLKNGRTTALITRSVATVSNKEELMDHIKKTGHLDLLQFRLATGAVDERREAGVKVPGTEYIDVYDLSDKQS